jgi:hypothetical protein
VWPLKPTTYSDTLVRRGLWLQNSPHNPTLALANEFKPRLFVLDIYREKVVEGASNPGQNTQPRVRLLDVQQDAFLQVYNQDYGGTGTVRVRGEAIDDHGIVGARIYTDNADLVGVSARVIEVTLAAGVDVDGVTFSDIHLHPDDATLLDGMEIGDTVMVSPVPVQAVAAPLRMEAGGQGFGDAFEYVSIRQLETVGIALADPVGYPITEKRLAAHWEALLFEGNVDEPLLTSWPKDHRGEQIFALAEGESQHYAAFGQHGKMGSAIAPGIRIICPDIDYRLLGINVTGTIRASVKSEYRA